MIFQSNLNNIWEFHIPSTELIQTIKEKYNLSYLTSTILANKKITINEINQLINPTLKENWLDTTKLPNINQATEIILNTIKKKHKIGIIGDYDVDGICSSIILEEFFQKFNIQPTIWIPNRNDGYGPNQNAYNFFSQNPVDLLIFVDCGTNSHDFINKYHEKIIVIDHHNSNNPIQKCLINPNASKETLPQEYKTLCATTLTFFVIAHILKQINHKDYNAILKSFLDLNALATVCDMMAMNNLNRSLIKAGIKEIEKQNRIGLRQLINFSKIKYPITGKDIGFSIGPRINACGRIESPEIALKLLKAKSFEETNQLIHKIECINNYRKEIQNIAFNEAITMAKQKKENILCLASEKWNAGIVGIIAAMISQEENKATIIGTIQNNKIKASARSNSINIGLLIERAVELELLEQGGGHNKAAGLTCSIDKWQEFEIWINQFSEQASTTTINIDASTTIEDISSEFSILGPFGVNNPQPIVLIKNLKINKIIDKTTYHLIIIEEQYKNYFFFINQSQRKLLNALIEINNTNQTFHALLQLEEKLQHQILDICNASDINLDHKLNNVL